MLLRMWTPRVSSPRRWRANTVLPGWEVNRSQNKVTPGLLLWAKMGQWSGCYLGSQEKNVSYFTHYSDLIAHIESTGTKAVQPWMPRVSPDSNANWHRIVAVSIGVFDLVLDIKSTNTTSLTRHACEQEQKHKTYNSRDSLEVTHPTPNQPVCGLSVWSIVRIHVNATWTGVNQLCSLYRYIDLPDCMSYQFPFKEPYGESLPNPTKHDHTVTYCKLYQTP